MRPAARSWAAKPQSILDCWGPTSTTSPALQQEYELTLTQVGLAIAAANAGSVFTLLAWGLLADRVGERVVLAAGLAGCGVGLFVAAFAPSFA